MGPVRAQHPWRRKRETGVSDDRRSGDGIARRGFLKITAVAAGLGVAGWMAGWPCDGERWTKVEETRLLMGTVANLTVLTTDRAQGLAAIAACFGEMQRLERIMSRFRSDSQLARLNRDGLLERAAPALMSVVESALDYSRLTEGAFDITVEPLLSARGRLAELGTPLDRAEQERLLSLVDFRDVKAEGNRIQLARDGMAITLDGIAKGFIIDEGARQLREMGFERILVEVGGDLVGGDRPQGAWRVGIRSPRAAESEQWIGVARLAQQALATSGDYMNTLTQDFTEHHIIDPRRGQSPAELASVSTLAPSAMAADALSTALLVMGVAEGLALVEGLPTVEALLIDKRMRVTMSTGFPLDAVAASGGWDGRVRRKNMDEQARSVT